MSQQAREAGFVVLDVLDAYPRDRSHILFERTDGHPNELGHEFLARALYPQLLAHAAELGLSTTDSTSKRQ
jgi:hypothetical protein